MPADLDTDSIGPVDVAVILFEGNEFNGDVAPALTDLNDSGTVRIIDLAFVRKDDDESVSYAEVADAQVADAFERLNDEHFDLLSEEDLNEIAAGLEAGSSALVIVWENSWAGRLAAAIRASRGQLIAQERIPRETVLEAIAALDEE
ncbi:MAG: DUF6325 family protein [Streptosporangiaceae bacterium]